MYGGHIQCSSDSKKSCASSCQDPLQLLLNGLSKVLIQRHFYCKTVSRIRDSLPNVQKTGFGYQMRKNCDLVTKCAKIVIWLPNVQKAGFGYQICKKLDLVTECAKNRIWLPKCANIGIWLPKCANIGIWLPNVLKL